MTFSVVVLGSQETQLKLKAMPPLVRNRLRSVIDKLTKDLARYVQFSKLSGQVLHVRTNVLRSSIGTGEVEETATGVHGIVGTNVVYGRIHELGGTVTIKEHMRMMTVAFGRPVRDPHPISVRAHQANYPQRSFLVSALEDKSVHITTTMVDTVRSAAKEAYWGSNAGKTAI